MFDAVRAASLAATLGDESAISPVRQRVISYGTVLAIVINSCSATNCSQLLVMSRDRRTAVYRAWRSLSWQCFTQSNWR